MIILYNKLILTVFLVVALIVVVAPIIATFCVPGLQKEKKHKEKKAKSVQDTEEELSRMAHNDSWLQALNIFPGTKWCGDGNIASGYDDLGIFQKEDACCRTHDNCDDFIQPGQTKYGLRNSASMTLFHCQCDNALYECLKKTSSRVGRAIGFAIFTLGGARCFKNEHPIISCELQKETISSQKFSRCANYNLNTTAPKVYQWFDNPLF